MTRKNATELGSKRGASNAPTPMSGAKYLDGLRVLIVEDEALIAEELQKRLNRAGLRVVDTVDTPTTPSRPPSGRDL